MATWDSLAIGEEERIVAKTVSSFICQGFSGAVSLAFSFVVKNSSVVVLVVVVLAVAILFNRIGSL